MAILPVAPASPLRNAWRRWVGGAWLIGVLALAGCAAPLPTPTTAPGPHWAPIGQQAGLLYERDDRQPGQVLHWLRLDLQDPHLRLTLTAPAQRGRALDRFDGAREALAALNASFFTAAFEPRGWTVSDGQSWTPVMSTQNSPLLSCDLQRRCAMTLAAPFDEPAHSALTVAGTPWLIRDGQPRQASDDNGCRFCTERHPRTAVGLDASGRYLTLVLAEGRHPGADGLALADLARRMAERGVWQALNLDGGGSTALLIQGQLVTGRPLTEPGLRSLANALLISVVPGAPLALP